MRHRFTFARVAILAATASALPAFAADMPKEGTFDYIACWSGVSTPVTFSKTHTANSFELMGTNRTTPPGGMFDKHSFRCVGMSASFDGKNTVTTVCEAIDADGDKRLTYFLYTPDGKVVREHVAGTGKFEGMAVTGTAVPVGPFPVIKAGTFQDCNRQTGTYKLK
jgi:hypothetical protein